MNYLDPIYSNNTGAVYAIKSNFEEEIQKVQLQIGDIAIVMENKEINAFLQIIKSAKIGESCKCKHCTQDKEYKIIKCDTSLANIRFRLSQENLDDLEELIMSVFFQEEFNSILINNEINS